MKKLFMVLAAVLSLGTAQLATADSCGFYARGFQAPVKRVVVAAPFYHSHYRWIAWHRDHRFFRYF